MIQSYSTAVLKEEKIVSIWTGGEDQMHWIHPTFSFATTESTALAPINNDDESLFAPLICYKSQFGQLL